MKITKELIKVDMNEVQETYDLYTKHVYTRLGNALNTKGKSFEEYLETGYLMDLIIGPIVIKLWFLNFVPIMCATVFPTAEDTLYIEIREY